MKKNIFILIYIFLTTALNVFSQSEPHKELVYLSGTDNEHTVNWDFWCTGKRKSGYWTQIAVPSHWEQQGFGAYNYGRDYVTYGKNFRFEDEKGLYKHSFEAPESWKNKDVYIVFDGSMTDTEVKINGQLAGPIHKGAFYRFKYLINEKLKYGNKNRLEITVSKMSSDRSVNNAERLADYWILGGIFRPVYLEILPKEHIDWTAINAQADGNFTLRAYLKNQQKNTQIITEIIDAKGIIVGKQQITNVNKDSIITLQTKIKKPLLWTAETPNRYTARIRLEKEKQIIYQTSEKFGFRTIEVRKGDGIFLNGTKIKMKGVNRHVWWPETGRSVNSDIDMKDVKLIKEMNMNAVRCSHYPPDKSFLNACDSLGLYVLDELAGWQKAYSTEAGIPLVKEMVIRDVNHPSILFWSNGNEGGHNFNLDHLFGKYDLSNRPVIHAHHKPGNAFGGIDCNHYENYYSTKEILADSNIYMPTEFMHAQDDGGAAAGLKDIWELHWNAKKGAGGFIWALLDEGLVRTDENNMIDVNGVNAPDGILGPHREKEGSFFAIKEIYSPIHLRQAFSAENFNGEIPIQNRYHFTNIKDCTFEWKLVTFRTPYEYEKTPIILQEGTSPGPAISPLENGIIKLNLPKDWKNLHADALSFKAKDPQGEEIYEWVWQIKPNVEIAKTLLKAQKETVAEISKTDSTTALKANGITVILSNKTGMITALQNTYSAKLSFNNGPVFIGDSAKFESLSAREEGNKAIIEAHYQGALKSITWTMHPSGWLEMKYNYELNGSYPYAGISFNYPENYVLGAKWLGNGPYRVWKNRLQGTTLGVWDNRYNNTQTGSAPWIYPEFKGYFSNLTWVQMNTVEGKFLIAAKEDNLFLRLFDFYALSGPKSYPALPKGNISFLDAIPPIGSKLALNSNPNAAVLGPDGEHSILKGLKNRTLYFYFGLPDTGENNQFSMPKENILTD